MRFLTPETRADADMLGMILAFCTARLLIGAILATCALDLGAEFF